MDDQQAMLIHVRHSLPCDDACSCLRSSAKQELSTDLAGLTCSSKKFSCSAAAYVRLPAERTYALRGLVIGCVVFHPNLTRSREPGTNPDQG